MHNGSTVPDDVSIHPVKFPGLDGPVVGVCKAGWLEDTVTIESPTFDQHRGPSRIMDIFMNMACLSNNDCRRRSSSQT